MTKTFIVELNSFEIEAENEEEAIEKATKLLKKDITLAYPLEVIENEDE